MARAGSLVFDLAADVSHLRTDMQKAQSEMNASLASIATSSAITAIKMGADFAMEFAHSFAENIKKALDDADAMGKLSERMGVSTEVLSAIKLQAESAGVSLEGVTSAFKGWAKASMDMRTPTSDAAAAIKALGLNVADLKGKKPDEAMRLIAEAVSKFGDGEDKIEVMRALFGKMGDELIPMMNAGAKGFDEWSAKAKELNAVVSGETAKAASDFNDQLGELKTMGTAAWQQLATYLLPTLKDLVSWFKNDVVQGGLLSETLLFIADAANIATRGLIGMKGVAEAASHLGKAAVAAAAMGEVAPGDEETRKAMRVSMLNNLDAMQVALDKTADQQKKVKDNYEAWKKSLQDRAGKQAADDADKAGKKTLDYAGALAEAAKAGKKAKEEVSDYQKMVESLDDAYRKIAAEGDPMKELLSDPKYLAAGKAQQEDLAARTQRNIDLKNAIMARTQAQEDANNEDARQYQQAAKKMKDDQDKIDASWDWAKAQQAAIDPMVDLNDQLDKLNEAFHNGAVEDLDQYNAILKMILENYDKAVDKSDPLEDQIKSLQQAIEGFGKQSSDAFVDFIFGTKDVAVNFSAMVSSVLKDMAKMLVYQNIMRPLFGLISKGPEGGWTDFLGNLVPKGGGLMAGGLVSPGVMYPVNEIPGRSEFFIPNVPGKVVTDAGAGGFGGPNVTVNVHLAKDEKATQETAANQRMAAEFGGRVATVVKQVIANERRTGGLLAPK